MYISKAEIQGVQARDADNEFKTNLNDGNTQQIGLYHNLILSYE